MFKELKKKIHTVIKQIISVEKVIIENPMGILQLKNTVSVMKFINLNFTNI